MQTMRKGYLEWVALDGMAQMKQQTVHTCFTYLQVITEEKKSLGLYPAKDFPC